MPIDVETIAATSRFTPATCYTDQRSSPCVLLDEWYEPIDVMRRYMPFTAVAVLVIQVVFESDENLLGGEKRFSVDFFS